MVRSGSHKAARLLTATLTLAMTLAVLPVAPAAGDCSGPVFDHRSGTVDRGSTLVITGFGWGDDCHDAGDPPGGEGVLGKPLTDIGIVLRQGEVEHLVAIGFADENYEFEVEIPIPVDLEPGPIEVRVDSPGSPIPGDPFPAGQLVVSDTAPIEPTLDSLVYFGEEAVEDGEDPDDGERITSDDAEIDSGSTNRSPAATIGLVVLVVAGLGVGFWLSRRRSGDGG